MTLDPTNPAAFTCTDIKALLSAIVDDELNPARRHEVERHLAECQSCRERVSQAEAIDAILAGEAELTVAGARISPGFEAAVLDRTVFAQDHAVRARRWSMWSGWFATAAALALAMTIWIVDRRVSISGPDQPGTEAVAVNAPTNAKPGREALAIQSSGSDASAVASGHQDEVDQAPDDRKGDAGTLLANGRNQSVVEPAVMLANGKPLPLMGPDPELALEYLDTVDAAARMMRLLREADVSSFSDVEQIRRLAVADDLPARLAELKPRLDDRDLPAVFAAEGMLLRIVNGPISSEDLRELQATARNAALPQQLDSIYERWNPRGTL